MTYPMPTSREGVVFFNYDDFRKLWTFDPEELQGHNPKPVKPGSTTSDLTLVCKHNHDYTAVNRNGSLLIYYKTTRLCHFYITDNSAAQDFELYVFYYPIDVPLWHNAPGATPDHPYTDPNSDEPMRTLHRELGLTNSQIKHPKRGS